MKMLVITLAAIVAVVAAVPAKPHADIYKNILASQKSRIVGGELAERHQFPYQASVRWGVLGSAFHICGGTLIDEKWVLTAGHCKAYAVGTYEVALGLLNQGEENEDIQIIEAAQFIVHPDYTGGVAANDIGLIQLKTSALLSEAVQLATLPAADQCSEIVDAILSGWGLTSPIPVPPVGLRWAQVPRITNQQCAADLTALLGNSGPLDDTMICTGSNEGQTQSSCSGDSGGPLVSTGNDKLIGVVSWGITPCGTKGAPSVYTNVCSHLDFIDLHVQ